MSSNYGPPFIQGGGDNAALFVGDGDYLGCGSYGKVWRAFHKKYRTVAVKVCELMGPNEAAIKEFQNEIGFMWSTNDCPYIIRCHGYFINKNVAGIVMEYMEHGTLYELLHHDPPIQIPIELKIRFAQNIAMALDYLHNYGQDQRIIHGDLKTVNILLDRFLVAKLSDFGGCRLQTISAFASNRNLRPGERNVYTPPYTAPEVLQNPGSKIVASGDMYSFGVVLWEVYTCERPFANFRNRDDLERAIRSNGVRLGIPTPSNNNNPRTQTSQNTSQLEPRMIYLMRTCLGSPYSRFPANEVVRYLFDYMDTGALIDVDEQVIRVRCCLNPIRASTAYNGNRTDVVAATRNLIFTNRQLSAERNVRERYRDPPCSPREAVQMDAISFIRQQAVTDRPSSMRNLSVHDWYRFTKSVAKAAFATTKGKSKHRHKNDSRNASNARQRSDSSESSKMSEARAAPINRSLSSKSETSWKNKLFNSTNSTNVTCLLCGDDGVGKHWAVSYDVHGTTNRGTGKRFKTTRKINGRDCSLKYVFSTEAKYVDVILYCFRIDDFDSIQNLFTMWNPEVEKKYGGAGIPTVLVGLQSDLRSHTDLSPMPIHIGNDKAKVIGAEVYLECSARTGYNVRNLFDYAFGLALGNVK